MLGLCICSKSSLFSSFPLCIIPVGFPKNYGIFHPSFACIVQGPVPYMREEAASLLSIQSPSSNLWNSLFPYCLACSPFPILEAVWSFTNGSMYTAPALAPRLHFLALPSHNPAVVPPIHITIIIPLCPTRFCNPRQTTLISRRRWNASYTPSRRKSHTHIHRHRH